MNYGGLLAACERCSLLNGESYDVPGLALIEDFEVFFTEVAHRVAQSIAYHHRHQYRIHLNMKRDAGVWRHRWFGLLLDALRMDGKSR